MNPLTKASALWGVVGLLSFLVLIQGYELASGTLVDWRVKAVVAVVVAIAAAFATRHSQRRIGPDERSRSADRTENESP